MQCMKWNINATLDQEPLEQYAANKNILLQ